MNEKRTCPESPGPPWCRTGRRRTPCCLHTECYTFSSESEHETLWLSSFDPNLRLDNREKTKRKWIGLISMEAFWINTEKNKRTLIFSVNIIFEVQSSNFSSLVVVSWMHYSLFTLIHVDPHWSILIHIDPYWLQRKQAWKPELKTRQK